MLAEYWFSWLSHLAPCANRPPAYLAPCLQSLNRDLAATNKSLAETKAGLEEEKARRDALLARQVPYCCPTASSELVHGVGYLEEIMCHEIRCHQQFLPTNGIFIGPRGHHLLAFACRMFPSRCRRHITCADLL